MQFYLITLGCPKNEVESENIIRLFLKEGFTQSTTPNLADILIVNTCGFINEAVQENLSLISSLNKKRELNPKKPFQKLIITGCLAQRYPKKTFFKNLKVDAWIPDWKNILEYLQTFSIPNSQFSNFQSLAPRLQTSNPNSRRFYAYVTIASGCSRFCTFCTIPHFKGKYQSKPHKEILTEIKTLLTYGIKEIILIAQDTSLYGSDLKPQTDLARLLKNIVKEFPSLPRIRIMYCYPNGITDELIETIADNPQICHYLDLPLQHSHPEILKKMGRPHDLKQTENLLSKLREKIPDICLRSTFIIGFPGETEEYFDHLLSFLKKWKFEKGGFFTYSKESGTKAANFKNQVSEKNKKKRLIKAYSLQNSISLEINKKLIGKKLEVLIENQKGYAGWGRSYREAPEIDGNIVSKQKNPPGDIVFLTISKTKNSDLEAV